MSSPGLSAQSRKQLSRLLRETNTLVTPEQAAKVLTLSRMRAAQQLARWAQAGWLARVQRGAYVAVPVESASGDVPLEDSWAVAAKLYAPCYIGGWSAAEHWGFTEQIFRSVCVMTATRPRKRNPELRGTQFSLHTVSEDKLFGLKTVWRGQVRVQVSDPARTLVDMLADPAFAGGIRNVDDMLAVLLRDHPADKPKLIEYARRFANGAIFKRLGFLIESRHPEHQDLINACRSALSAGYAKLDPKLPAERLVTAWRLWVPRAKTRKTP